MLPLKVRGIRICTVVLYPVNFEQERETRAEWATQAHAGCSQSAHFSPFLFKAYCVTELVLKIRNLLRHPVEQTDVVSVLTKVHNLLLVCMKMNIQNNVLL